MKLFLLFFGCKLVYYLMVIDLSYVYPGFAINNHGISSCDGHRDSV